MESNKLACTIDEIRDLKEILEEKILDAIQKFENTTSCFCDSINIDTANITTIGEKNNWFKSKKVVHVNVDIKIFG